MKGTLIFIVLQLFSKHLPGNFVYIISNSFFQKAVYVLNCLIE
jgi:hypothetical protein